MNLWMSLRRSLQRSAKRNISSSSGEAPAAQDGQIFNFPYGTKECVVTRRNGKPLRR